MIVQLPVKSTMLSREVDAVAVAAVWDDIAEPHSISFQVPGRLERGTAWMCEEENSVNMPVLCSAGTAGRSRVIASFLEADAS